MLKYFNSVIAERGTKPLTGKSWTTFWRNMMQDKNCLKFVQGKWMRVMFIFRKWQIDHTFLDCLTILWQMWTIAQPLNGWGQRSRVFKLTTSENERSFPFLLCVVCSRPVLANLNLVCRFAGRKWCAVCILKIAVWALCKCASGH